MTTATETRHPFAGIDGHSIHVDDDAEGAIREADRIRREHNGIGGVYLYLGHDGDNACEFRDFDGKTLAKAHSGRTLSEAVERCKGEWRRAQWQPKLKELMRRAAESFAGGRAKIPDGVFSTVCLQGVIRQGFDNDVTADEIVAVLTPRRDVIRLECDGHWMVMPANYFRHA